MTAKINDLHIKQVEAWERKNADGLSLEKQLKLFEKAFHAIEQRTLKTLSNVTFQVVLDRVLLQNTDKFPFLSEVKLEPQGLNFEVLIRNSADLTPEVVPVAIGQLRPVLAAFPQIPLA